MDEAIMHKAKEMGNFLRQRRKELNFSLKEAENATSIRMNYLQALEEGEMEQLISPIYAQGFFKQYASFLGVDGESLVKENPAVFNFGTGETQEFSYGIGTLEGRSNPGSGVKWFPNAFWIFAFVAVLIAAWYFARYIGVIG